MKTHLAIVIATIAMAGCATKAGEIARAEVAMDRRIEVYGPVCDKIGFKRDTDAWRNCVVTFNPWYHPRR